MRLDNIETKYDKLCMKMDQTYIKLDNEEPNNITS